MPISDVAQGSSILPQVGVDFQLIDPPINTSNPPMNLLQSGGEMDTVASTGTEALGDLDLHARNEQGATNPEQGEGDLGPDEQGAEISEQGANQSPRGNRMRKRFNLEEGKVKCRCLIRRWRFCPHHTCTKYFTFWCPENSFCQNA